MNIRPEKNAWQDGDPNVPAKNSELAFPFPVGTHGPSPSSSGAPTRFEAIDLARGFAILLMIVSHGVKGLLTFEQMPEWGLVPIHLITKFSSSLFLLVFGITLTISFVPHIGTPAWPEKRKKLMVRGLRVFFWYKALTIVEMAHLYGPNEIWAALTYKQFPVYVEILGFYSIILLWIPWVLPLWKSSHALVRLMFPVAFLGLAIWLPDHFDFFGSDVIQALLIEHPNYYVWGQLTRAPVVFAGMNIGWLLQAAAKARRPRLIPFAVLGVLSACLAAFFLWNAGDRVYEELVLIAMNVGKHPPKMQFMLFSLSGALLIIGVSVLGGKSLSAILSPVRTIGQNSLRAFVFHIVVLFTFYRFLFDYFHKIEYERALFLSLLLVALTYAWLQVSKWVRENS